MTRTWQLAAAVSALTLVATASPVAAQQADDTGGRPAAAEAGPTVELDLAVLLDSPDVVVTSVSDGIWKLQAEPGTALVQLPLIVEPGERQGQLDSSAISMRGGRFLAWRVDEAGSATGRAAAGRRTITPRGALPTGSTHPRDRIGALRPEMAGSVIGRGGAPALQNAPNQAPDDSTASWPRLARTLSVDPDGTVRWKLDRLIPGGTVTGTDLLYAMKIDPELLNKSNPGPTPRITRNADESPQDYQARRRREQVAHRQKLQAFGELRKRVLGLPTEFEQPSSPRLWAIFGVRGRQVPLQIHGDTIEPWTITLDQLDALRDASKSRRGDQQLSTEGLELISQLAELVRDNHPYNHRLVAYVLANTGMAKLAQRGGPLHQLIQTLLGGPDDEARIVVIDNLASIAPPSPVVSALLRNAWPSMNPQMKLAAIRGLLRADLADAAQRRQMLLTVNSVLADPTGPPADAVLEVIVETARQQPDLTAILATGVRFELLPAKRRDRAIVAALELAGQVAPGSAQARADEVKAPLAAAWVNHQLLGSANPTLVRRTLELLDAVEPGESWIKPATAAMLEFVFGPPAGEATDRNTLTASLAARIPIESVDHSLLRVIQHGDPPLRDLAWRALRHFTMTPPVSRRGSRATNEPDARYEMLVDAAMSRQPNPMQIVVFLDHEGDAQQVTDQLVRIAYQASSRASAAAVRALIGSGRKIDVSIEALSADDRFALVTRVYEVKVGQAPLVVGLMRPHRNADTVVRWLGQQLADGNVPAPAQWAGAVANERTLLEMASASDDKLALAAAAALVASVGGDERDAQKLLDALRSQTDQTGRAMQPVWDETRRQLYTRRLKTAAGPYSLVLNIYHQSQAPRAKSQEAPASRHQPLSPGRAARGPNPQPPVKPEQVIALGIVQLQVSGQVISFGSQAVTLSVSETHL
ncbi:MAG: hypothetical protein V3U29_03700, partial [Phycisphaeraceae bacterium]